MKDTGTVFEIQRLSTEDGPGIRTTVFLKGCGLNCVWCHNPESISPVPELHWFETRCINCRTCIKSCPEKALSIGENGVEINRERCIICNICTYECPSAALGLIGRKWTPRELADEIIKDRAYFEKSGGGITLGGGEPTLQAVFCIELLKILKEAGIHTALDTCGQTKKESLDMILPYTDMVLFDLKEIEPEKHREFTGADNKLILENIKLVSDYITSNRNSGKLWVRTPVIPGATDSADNIAGISRFIVQNLEVSRWELLAFNNLCRDKYLRIGRKWKYHDSPLISSEKMEMLVKTAVSNGIDPDKVKWSCTVKQEI